MKGREEKNGSAPYEAPFKGVLAVNVLGRMRNYCDDGLGKRGRPMKEDAG